MRIPILAYTVLALAACACNGHSAVSPEPIKRLDLSIAGYTGGNDVIDSMRPGLEALSQVTGSDLTFDSALAAYSNTRGVKVFSPDIQRILPSLSSAEMSLGEIKYYLATELPGVKMPAVYGIVSTSDQYSVYNVGDVMLVGLNHYLGENYEGYRSFETYRRKVKTIDHLPLDVAEALVSQAYPYQPVAEGNPTLLSQLLYSGAVTEAKHRLLPSLSDRELLDYDEQEWKWLEDNERPGWNSMIGRDMIYNVDPVLADRMLLPSPATVALHQDAPGRAGRYYGYKIVKSYLKAHPDVSLEKLLSPSFYNSTSTLKDSRYTAR